VNDEQFSDADLELVSQWLKDAERIVVFTGAGISTDSGIPDFRGPNGLWVRNPLAEKTSTLSYYLNDPEVRKVAWEGRVRNFNGTAQPNDGHHALVHMQQVGKLSAVITQNVDGLHQDSGIEPANVVEVHGTIKFGRCWDCKDRRPMKYFIDRGRWSGKPGGAPRESKRCESGHCEWRRHPDGRLCARAVTRRY